MRLMYSTQKLKLSKHGVNKIEEKYDNQDAAHCSPYDDHGGVIIGAIPIAAVCRVRWLATRCRAG